MDESPPPLGDITIASGGSLVFDPTKTLIVRVSNVLVFGSFEIGSEDCPHNGKLEIILTGEQL